MTTPCSPELLAALRLVRDGGTLPEGDVPDGIGFAFLSRDCLSNVGAVLLATAEALEVERLRTKYAHALAFMAHENSLKGNPANMCERAAEEYELAKAALVKAGGTP